MSQPGSGDGVEEWPGLGAGGGELVEDVEELVGHLGGAEVAAGQAEGPDVMVEERGAFGGAVADAIVFHEHDPAVSSGASEPVGVGDGLVGGDAVDLGQGAECNCISSELRS